MSVLAAIAGTLIVLLVLWEAFETVVLPRRVTRRFRLTRAFYRNTWTPWRTLAGRFRNQRRREGFIAFYGPLSLLVLLALWAGGLVLGFAVLHWAGGSVLVSPDGHSSFSTDLYFSGTTFFTLGLGDVRPNSAVSRILAAVEAGMGFGFLAMVISYLPVLYQSFSRREVNVSLLDARAGTPPTAAELLRRNAHQMRNLEKVFHEWEHWATELLESHISYPVLAYFRSQHDNQSWLGALTAILDATALCQVGVPGAPRRQAQLTFAMARHAVVDLAQVFNTPPHVPEEERLTPVRLQYLREQLDSASLHWEPDAGQRLKLVALREMYEPYIGALAQHFLVDLPPWSRPADAHDNWRTSRWGGIAA
jgi:Ion channel